MRARFGVEALKIGQELSGLRTACGGPDKAALQEKLEIAQARAFEADAGAQAAENACVEARALESRLRQPYAEAQQKAQKLETESETLSKLLGRESAEGWPPVLEEIKVVKGYEAALGIALGEDLQASTSPDAPARWALLEACGDLPLPHGAIPLSIHVQAPPALSRRLGQTGLVRRDDGPALWPKLHPGQILVSAEGDLWRWDGFTQKPEAPSAAARKLVEKNRLDDLIVAAEAARGEALYYQNQVEGASAALEAAIRSDIEARQSLRQALREEEGARTEFNAAEKDEAKAAARIAALVEAEARLAVQIEDVDEKFARAEAALGTLVQSDELARSFEQARDRAAADRTAMGQARGDLQSHLREVQGRGQRLKAIDEEIKSWTARKLAASRQIGDLSARLKATQAEYQKLLDAPDAFILNERRLLSEIKELEAAFADASAIRGKAEAELTAAAARARQALAALGASRETKAASEARVQSARQKSAEIANKIEAELECGLQDLVALAELPPDAALPVASEVEKRLESLKGERSRLGAVNLCAEAELTEIEGSQNNMMREREDLTEAIARLRQAIANLNKEGRERLLAAFNSVNGYFRELFTTLFQGGSAELQLVESADPLEAGLEIMAMPPGKKPQVMTLLSGGEQALTALSLIFAIFLTNPSPICVLDEVDAPLDDANVERFCDLLDHMAKKTQTRFITITHNPITMARMSRLFGVTMAERGVSQLVSVDLEEAERFLDAG